MNITKSKRPRITFQDFQEEMNRMLSDAFEDLGITESRAGRQELNWRPSIELNEKDGSYQLKAELPGIDKEDIDVQVGEDSVTIKAETKQKEEEKGESIYRSEIRYGKFLRTIPLPSDVDNSNAKAEFKNGILTVTVPKTQEEHKKLRKLTIES